ncbi:MAG: hypothetical protein E7K85_07700 [Clostridium sp.]|uniref:hypothetical protein n=1 Tax=Clostridium sp. TaxID=1506 RepID=UPI002908A5A3|nr:hypothetical protein [Clostridium sp.]MDU4428598.1 hypothetical protein [Clostridium sp.]MDU7460505.1 hypothetical protein [Clostridium sp.]
MLSMTKSINLTGQSVIDGKQAIFMSASITTEGNQAPNTNVTIMDQESYAANKVACRADIDKFNEEVYKVQDTILIGGVENEVK